MDDEDYTVKNEVISGIPNKLCSGETGQESAILQPQTGRRRRKHKSRKICNKTNLEVNATSSGNELSCSIPGFNNTITCDDKEAVSLEHTKSVEDSGVKTNSEINMLDAFVSQSSGDNNNQDINEPSNAQYFDAYDNISPVTEHLVQPQIEEQNCNCNEFSRGGETLCAWCFVTEDGQRCRPANSWNEMDAGGIQLETNEISTNQEFSYGIEGLSEKTYAIPVVSFGSNEMVETCSTPIDSTMANVIYETKPIEDINESGICSSNVQQICSPYIEHTTEPFEINTKYNVEDNSAFYEKKCDEPAHMNIMEYADGYYDSSGVYCFASVYESNKESRNNSTLTGSSHEMTSDFYDAHSSEHFISIPSQTDCVEPLPADLNYRFPSDFEHVSPNLGNVRQHEEIGNSYENYRTGDIDNVKLFSDSCCQNNDFINENHLLRGIDELLLNKEECINDVKNEVASCEVFCPQYSQNTHKVDSNATQANNLSSNNSDDIMDEGYENEDIDDDVENILKKGKDQFQLLTNSSPCEDSTSANTSNSRPSTPNNSVNLKITSDEDKSLSASALDPVFSISNGTMASDKSNGPTASISFIPTDTQLHAMKKNHQDKERNDFINSLKPEEPFRSEERTSSFVTPFTIDGIQEKMQTGISDLCDTTEDPNTKSGITLECTANELNEGSNIQAHSATETDSILSVKSVAEIIEFYNKLNDVEPEEISREFNKCVKVKEVPALDDLKYENTVFTESGTCLCVQENCLNNEFSTVASQTELINKVKGIKSESSSFNKNSYSQYSANNSLSSSEIHSRDLECLKREFKINDKENIIYARKFDNPVAVFNSCPLNESSCDCTNTVENAAKPFSNHYFTEIGSGISNLTNEKSQSETSGEDLNESITTVKFLETNTSCHFSDLAAALNSDSIKYYSKAFINDHFISVDEDYDIDAIQIKQNNFEKEMFWDGSSSRVFTQDVQRSDNSDNKVNSDAVLSEKLSLRSVERINDENNFTGSEVSSPRSVSNSIPKVAFEDILYSYCSNIDKKSSGIKNLINTGVSVKQLAKGFDVTALTDTPKGFSFRPKTHPGVQNDSSAKRNCITKQEKSEDAGVLSNEDVAQSSEKKPPTSKTNICSGYHNSKIDGLIKEFGGKGAFRKKRRNIESEFKTETHRCLCMSKSTNAIVAEEKSMRAVNEMSCQTVDSPVDAHLYHYTEKYGENMDCSSNVSVKDIISFFTNYPDPSKAENFPEEHPTYDVEAKCCRTNSFSNLCSACDRKQNCTQGKSSFIADDSKKMATAERKNELVVVLTEPETGGVLESPSDNIFLQDRRAASVPFVVCSRPESLMRLNTGEGGNKFLLVLPDVHKLWMKTLPGGKKTISQLTEYIQKSREDTDYASTVSVKDLVSRWNQNSSASQ